jgi:cyclophilin family peptidyl-prolyl cis-trans isomerase
VFGRVIEGMDVVDRMVAVHKLPQGDHLPAKDIIIKSARVIKSEEK